MTKKQTFTAAIQNAGGGDVFAEGREDSKLKRQENFDNFNMNDTDFSDVFQAAKIFANYDRPWAVCGGWAIDLFLKSQIYTRS